VRNSITMVWLLAIIGAMLVAGCGGPPKDAEDAVREAILEKTQELSKDATIGKITFAGEMQKEKGSWPYEAEILDPNGKRIGKVQGRYIARLGVVSGPVQPY